MPYHANSNNNNHNGFRQFGTSDTKQDEIIHGNIDPRNQSSSDFATAPNLSTEWIPPPPMIHDSQQQQQQQQQQQREQMVLYKQQERMDAVQEEQDALLQLTEEELETLSDDEILERVEKVLAMEEALQKQIMEQQLQREKDEKDKRHQKLDPIVNQEATDWLATRRAALGKTRLMDDAESPVVPVLKHELLTAEDIQTILQSEGGSNVTMLMDDPDYPRMGGAQGMIFCTGGGGDGGGGGNGNNDGNDMTAVSSAAVNPFVINSLARVLIHHLKERQLDEVGVLGAQMGTNHLTPRGTANTPGFLHSTWHVIDCGNYIVHIMDSHTRNHLKLEDLWSGKDPLWKLQYWNEDQVEEYCEKHPVPSNYNGGNGNTSGHNSYWDPSMVRRLEQNQYASAFPSHRPVIPNSTKRRDRQAGRRKKREQRQAQRLQQRGY